MLDMSWGEIMVIGAVALIVIGPKDLPKALRTVGQMTGKLRRMAAEFQGQFNEAMREAELDEVKKQLQGVNDSVPRSVNTSFNPIQTIRDELKTSIEAPVAGLRRSPLEPPRQLLPEVARRAGGCERLRRVGAGRRGGAGAGACRSARRPAASAERRSGQRRSPNPCGGRPNTRPSRPRLAEQLSEKPDAKVG